MVQPLLAIPKVLGVEITDDTLTAHLEDGRTITVPIGWYTRLAHGLPAERLDFVISSAGYGIHWPQLDEDIAVEGLLLGKNPPKAGFCSPSGYSKESSSNMSLPCAFGVMRQQP